MQPAHGATGQSAPVTGFDLTTSVAAGNQIDFVVDSLGTNYWDLTTLDPTITFTAT